MSLPDILQPHLDDEQIAARVSLGGEDELFVTPTRTLIYRADGLLSDESVDEYPHDAERVSLNEGRRKTKVELDYGIDGDRTFTVPTKRVNEVLHPVLAGVLNGAGVTEPGETIEETYRFSELTLVITSARIVKHIGTSVWDREYEEYHYEDIRSIEVEEGSVSSQIVIDVAGRPQRVKAQNDVSREIFERLKRALLAYRDVSTYAEFEALFAEDEEEPAEPTPSIEFDDSPAEHWADSEGVEPIEVNLPDEEEEIDPLAADASEPEPTAEPAEPAGRAESATEEAASDGSGAVANRQPATASRTEPEPAPRTESAGRTERAESAAKTESAPSRTAAEPATASEPARTTPSAEPEPEAAADAGFAGSEFETATSNLRDEHEETVAELARAVERQGELLAEQQRVIEELVAELELSRDR